LRSARSRISHARRSASVLRACDATGYSAHLAKGIETRLWSDGRRVALVDSCSAKAGSDTLVG
jgi:hypothetical protein